MAEIVDMQLMQKQMLDAINAALNRFEIATDHHVTFLVVYEHKGERGISMTANQKKRIVLPGMPVSIPRGN